MLVEKQGADRDASGPAEARATGEGVSVEHGPAASSGHRITRKRRLLIGVIGALVLAAVAAFGVPYIQGILNTVSTDDAYVNGHVTFVAPRVGGQISRVLVDDNNRVHKGDLIAELDKEPYQIALSEKSAAVDTANADLLAATAIVRGIEAQASSARWRLQHAFEDVDNRIALLHARVAALDKNKAALTLAQLNFDRAKELVQRRMSSAVRSSTAGKRSSRLPAPGSPNPLPKSTKSACPWVCRRNPRRAKISVMCRAISIRRSPPSSKRSQT